MKIDSLPVIQKQGCNYKHHENCNPELAHVLTCLKDKWIDNYRPSATRKLHLFILYDLFFIRTKRNNWCIKMFSVSTRWNFFKKVQILFCKISKKQNKTKQTTKIITLNHSAKNVGNKISWKRSFQIFQNLWLPV